MLAGQIDAGQLQILAYTGENDPETTPDAPQFSEAGIENVEGGAWWGIFAPLDTPSGIVEQMNAAINDALTDDTLGEFLRTAGAQIQPMSPEEFRDVIAAEVEMLSRYTEELGIEIAN